MFVISHNDIKKMNISAETCYGWVKNLIENKSSVLLPPKISLKPSDGVFCNVMPSFVPVDGKVYGGVKIVTRYPERKPALDSKLLLFDADSGEFKAIMDANWITAVRTGAVATHSILLLAKQNFDTVAFIGLGNTARTTLDILSEIKKDTQLNIKLFCYKGQEELFAERFKNKSNLRFTYHSDFGELISGSQVVVSAATYLPNDISTGYTFDEGTLLVPIHTLGFTNCDLYFDKIFADDYGHVCHFKNFAKFKYFAEVSDVVNKKAEGRKTEKERIIAYNIGLAMHDIFYAAKIYEMMNKEGLQKIDFAEPKDKFWI